ncbi:BAG domain family protein [Candida parapsilosis]|uniref:BAG domain-containing protein n=2 Tax=Candida parapsilosis TaxID=5480 RepID=G8BCJ2_CANPC|nr:uncharacterized protein CPAR2_804080 [Candida parapsilosis]KAF6051756.1 BAG domain family protein [Candida parapsilosis]KAF6052747.1 BAG domain family protein [Candida parapsilosis]KAF6053558.1 BAG domain family protein [Candida parapsilosis]KAF6064524.1 BAG domain family protein [Candida parapsilosis]KAI5904119.1 hypothetical protein K4G60_g3277 [Candida parapsilosis]
MDQIKNQIPTTTEELHYYVELVMSKLTTHWDQLTDIVHHHTHDLTFDGVMNDFKNFNVNSVTVSLTLVSVTTLVLLGKVLGAGAGASSGDAGSSDKYHGAADAKKHKKKSGKKKLSRAQKSNKEIQEILDYVESEYVPEIDKYIESYETLSKDDLENKFKFYDEMLLKELVKLDGIDVTGNDILRENRKKVIKFIQDHQKRLDKFKRDISV